MTRGPWESAALGTEALGGRRRQPQRARGRSTALAQAPGSRGAAALTTVPPRGRDRRRRAWHPALPCGEARGSVPPRTSVQVGGWLSRSEGLLGAREPAAVRWSNTAPCSTQASAHQ